jgi:hypothetical protein
MKKYVSLVLILFALVPAAVRADDVGAISEPNSDESTEATLPLIGSDDVGQTVEVFVSRKKYQGRLKRMIHATELSAMPALDAAAAKQSERKRMRLRTVVIGMGLDLSVGLPLLITLNATPRFRMAFANAADPIIP